MLWVAIISLVLMAQVMPGLANPYDLISDAYDCTEVFPLQGGGYTPGDVGSTFLGSNSWDDDDAFWQIGDLSGESGKALWNSVKATVEIIGDEYTYVYTYDKIEEGGSVKFRAVVPDEGLDITSSDTQITITATYKPSGPLAWSFQSGSMVGSGTDDVTEIPFTISAILFEESNPNHTHYLHFESFKLTYPASAVPLPGSVWLLSTGILGIWCLGRRRKE
jgi:hypothetical protein